MDEWRKEARGERWQQQGPQGGWVYLQIGSTGYPLPESIADRILADHKAAEELAKYVDLYQRETAVAAELQHQVYDLRSQLAAAREALEEAIAPPPMPIQYRSNTKGKINADLVWKMRQWREDEQAAVDDWCRIWEVKVRALLSRIEKAEGPAEESDGLTDFYDNDHK